MDILEPVVQPYAWGSTVAIAELQQRPVPALGPEAELWMGAHPSAPSGLTRGAHRTTLDVVVAADPVGELGRECVDRFGSRLPFLLKVLAAEKALSIQVHPDRTQAEAGFKEENDRGLDRNDLTRNYVDDWPKPEIICALTPFEALAGFRSPGESAEILEALGLPRLLPLLTVLRTAAPPACLTEALRLVTTWPAAERGELIAELVAACARLAAAGGEHAAAYDAAVRIAADHPGDAGVLASLLFRHLVLAPGEALFMPAGGLHAYVKGVGVELLANSDNVLRAGLTGKHMDVPELLRIVDPTVEVPVLRPEALGESVAVYHTPAPEFELYRLTPGIGSVTVPGAGPRIVLCVEGGVVLQDPQASELQLGRGESCFLSAADDAVTATGDSLVFVAAVG
ncbi:mannose-6-phosphate isomerase, class I [Kitasatospora sp. MBT63]|uniref:mannose-6-phosphate isomerase, class I n=1 Tax=Kitasatospora sp. MBT63 TaxID=1444768 RepID=UPI00053A86F6|nr:mannose-6-phosphate isomerase, class I [Kitasatospora sp. MBT63]